MKNILSHTYLLSILFAQLIFFQFANAQQKQTYVGNYLLDGRFLGEVTYSYFINKKDTILDGQFLFKSIQKDVEDAVFNQIKMDGNYQGGLKHGNWVIEYSNLSKTSQASEESFQIIYNTSGVVYRTLGIFEKGKATGQWTSLLLKLENSLVVDTIFQSSASFVDNKLVGKISGVEKGVHYTGSINANGFLDDVWQFNFSNNTSETRTYQDGILLKYISVSNVDTTLISEYNRDSIQQEKNAWQRVPLSSRYFQAIEIMARMNSDQNAEKLEDSHGFLGNLDTIIEHTFSFFTSYKGEQIWQLTPGGAPEIEVFVRLKPYPYSADENKKIKDLEDLTADFIRQAHQTLQSKTIEIEKLANLDLLLATTYIAQYNMRMMKVQRFVAKLSDPALNYVDRRKYIKYVIQQISLPQEVTVLFDDSLVTRPYSFAQPKINENGVYTSLIDWCQRASKDLKKLQTEINSILADKMKEQRLLELEDRYITLSDSLENLYNPDAEFAELNLFQTRTAAQVLALNKEMVYDYARLDLENKLQQVEPLMACTEKLIHLYHVQDQMPRRLKRIEELYTRTVWNPFTMTYIDERMKERVYLAFSEELMTWFLTEVDKNISCSSTFDWKETFTTIYNRMIDLRNQDTKDIERALRGVQNPQRIMNILGLDLIEE